MTRKGWVLFAAMSIVWGIPYFFIKIALQELDPAIIVFARVCIAALVLIPIALFRRQLYPLRKRWYALLLLSIIQIAIPFLLIGYGEKYIASSLTSLLISAEPILIALLALRFDPSERVPRVRFVGLAVGMLGVVVLLGFDVSGNGGELLGAGLILVATISYSFAALLVKQPTISSLPSVGVVAVECAISTVLLFPFTLSHLPTHLPSFSIVLVVVILGLVCTALAFLIFYALIVEVGATRGTVFTYINPAVSVLLGVILLHEAFNVFVIIGFIFILLGSWLSTSVTSSQLLKHLLRRRKL